MPAFEISLSEEFRNIYPGFVGAAVFSRIKNTPFNEDLWKKIETCIHSYTASHSIEDIKKNPVIHSTRQAYKKMGKDPNRYRPSSEALGRRIVKGMGLYQINTVVDIINLVSIETGYSIGGFDTDKIDGNKLILGIGKENEPYEAIGRGMMNIEGLPVYRDNKGGIGTPTSDEERTKLDINSRNLLAILNGYNGKEGLQEAADSLLVLLQEFASCTDAEIVFFG